uniref:uncharacterized protein LOC120332233 n=1 Tax=Styela clava TaxID=7725 RepID=UPI00193AAB1D|nr:uncharacterized protein LOC120332233 [Styela clava]
MTGVMLNIFQILTESEHIRDKVNIAGILNKLKKIAFTGTSEKRVVFESKELQDSGIDTKTIRDIVVKVPGSSMFRQNLLDGQYRFFFSHQTIQEILAALYVCEMNLPEFEDFVQHHLHLDHWSVVRRFLCGSLINDTLANNEFYQLLKIDQKNEKREILRRSMDEELKQAQDSLGLMELFGSLYEANDAGLIKDHVKVINFENTAINPNFKFRIHSNAKRNIMRRNEKAWPTLQSFDAPSTNIHCYCSKDALLLFLHAYKHKTINNFTWKPPTEVNNSAIVGPQVDKSVTEEEFGESDIRTINNFTLKSSTRMSAKVFADISSFVESHVDKFVTEHEVEFDENDIGILSQSNGSKKMRIHQVLIGDSVSNILFSQLGDVCSIYDVRICDFSTVELEAIPLRNFRIHARNSKLKKLDVSFNNSLGVDGISEVGSTVLQCEVENVNMSGCRLAADAMKAFKNNTRGAKFKTLDVSNNEFLGVDGISEVGSTVLQCEVEDVYMSWCALTADAMKAFKNNTRGAKFKTLDVSYNDSLGVDGISEVGSTVLQCEVETVGMAGCALTAEAMKAFKNKTRGAKLKKLDVSHNFTLGVDGISEVGSTVLQCEVEDVDMSKCALTADAMKAFKNNTHGAKFKTLDVSYNRSLGVDGISEVGSTVLQCEVEDVDMRWCKLTADAMKAFKNNTRGAKVKLPYL